MPGGAAAGCSPVKRFRGGLVFKAVSLNSRLESNKEEEKESRESHAARERCREVLQPVVLLRRAGGEIHLNTGVPRS